MSENIIQLNENLIKTELKSLVKQSVEDTLNEDTGDASFLAYWQYIVLLLKIISPTSQGFFYQNMIKFNLGSD